MSTVQGGYAGRPGTKAIFDEAGSFCASLSGERSVHYTRPHRHDEIICPDRRRWTGRIFSFKP